MSAHLISKGFEPLLGDPCLFKRINPDGSKIFAAVYVDDNMFMELPITKLCLSVLSSEVFVKSESVDTPMLPTPLRNRNRLV